MAFVPNTLLIALGETKLIARCYVAELVPYLACATLLTARYGATGAAIAWSLRAAADALLFAFLARRVAGFSFSPVADKKFGYACAITLLVLPVLVAGWLWDAPAAHAGVAIASLLLYGVLMWTSVLGTDERAWISGKLPTRFRRTNALT
jgi:O-antigen/teichoic acid export membrane protein